MKTNGKSRILMFGDFIAGCYQAWGVQRAKGFVRLAVNANLVEFLGGHRFVIVGNPHENLSFKSHAE